MATILGPQQARLVPLKTRLPSRPAQHVPSTSTSVGECMRNVYHSVAPIWSVFSTIADPFCQDTTFWWTSAGAILAEGLHQAQYALQDQLSALHFFYLNIAPGLGARPPRTRRSLEPPGWKSFMTDDFSPIEFSWNWGTRSKVPDVRYSVEMIGQDAGTPADPFNQRSTLQLASDLQDSLPETDWTWFHAFFEAFRAPDVENVAAASLLATQNPNHSSPSSVFLAFEHHRSGPTVPKAYFVPSIRSLETLESPLSTVTKALMTLPNHSFNLATSFPAYTHLVSFLKTNSLGKEMSLIFLAIDCVPSSQESRLKIYLRSPRTDIGSMLEVLSMGGTLPYLQDRESTYTKKVTTLFNTILDNRPQEATPQGGHETAGMLFYFDCAPSQQLPRPKIYLPAKHYARSDAQAYRALSQWMRDDRGPEYADRWCPRFRNLLGTMGVKEEDEISEYEWRQGSRARTQTYVSVGFEEGGQLNVTSYLGPGVYAKLERMAAGAGVSG